MAAGSMFGLPGMLIGGAVAGAANLYMGSQTEKQKEDWREPVRGCCAPREG